jgi:hypothetical protein
MAYIHTYIHTYVIMYIIWQSNIRFLSGEAHEIFTSLSAINFAINVIRFVKCLGRRMKPTEGFK